MTNTIRPALMVKDLAIVLGGGPAQVRRMIRDGPAGDLAALRRRHHLLRPGGGARCPDSGLA